MRYTTTVYEGARFDVDRAENGYEWIDPGDVVAVLPVDDQYIYLAKQYRTPIDEFALALCAGKIDPGEDPEEAARRELKEEYGFEAEHMVLTDEFYSSEGITNEKCYLFRAHGLTQGVPTDLSERVDVVPVHHSELNHAIERVNTAKAKIALLQLSKEWGT